MFRKLFSILLTPKTLLGRWTPTDMKKNNIKLDWANVDHCGTCSYEVKTLKKPEETKETKETVKPTSASVHP